MLQIEQRIVHHEVLYLEHGPAGCCQFTKFSKSLIGLPIKNRGAGHDHRKQNIDTVQDRQTRTLELPNAHFSPETCT